MRRPNSSTFSSAICAANGALYRRAARLATKSSILAIACAYAVTGLGGLGAYRDAAFAQPRSRTRPADPSRWRSCLAQSGAARQPASRSHSLAAGFVDEPSRGSGTPQCRDRAHDADAALFHPWRWRACRLSGSQRSDVGGYRQHPRGRHGGRQSVEPGAAYGLLPPRPRSRR